MAKQESATGREQAGAGKIGQLKEYFVEAHGELKKVTWPLKKEWKISALAVLLLVVIMSIFLSIADLGLSKIVQLILS